MHLLPRTAVIAVFVAALTSAAGKAEAEPRIKKLAVMPLEVLGVDGRIGRLLDYAVTFEASARGDYEVVSAQEIAALIGMEKLREVLGCDTIACAAEIGGAIDADFMISGSVGKLGSRLSINLILFDVRRLRTKGRVRKEVADDEDLLRGAATAALVQLLGEVPAPVLDPLVKAPARQEPPPAKPVLPLAVAATPVVVPKPAEAKLAASRPSEVARAPAPKPHVPEAPHNDASQPGMAVASAPPAESVKQVASSPSGSLAGTKAATEQTQALEEIKAAPVDVAQTQTAATIRAREEAEKKPWAVTVVLDHALGSGTFIRNSTLRGSRAYVAQSWDIRPSWVFPVAGHHLKLAGRFSFGYEYTTPDTNPARRFRPADSRVSLSDAELYEEQLTGITFNAGTTVFLPTSYESINVKKQWAGLRLSAGASRSVGPVDLAYSLATTKYLHSNKFRTTYTDALRDGEGTLSGTSEPGSYAGGPANTSFDVINSFGVTYNVTDKLSVGYALLIWNTFAYRDNAVNAGDQFASINADQGRGRSDMLWPSLEVAYRLDGLVKDVLPFGLTVSGGITALHPAQTADNQGILWPVFYQAFAQNRAANNYGSIFFDLTGTL